MAQDNVIKKPVIVGTPNNAAGNESGVSTTAGLGAVAKNYSGPTGNDGINGTASSENRAAKFHYPNVSEDVPSEGKNQYQGQ